MGLGVVWYVCACKCVCVIEIQQVGNCPDETESPISPLSKRKVAPSTLVADIDLCVCVRVSKQVKERQTERNKKREQGNIKVSKAGRRL